MTAWSPDRRRRALAAVVLAWGVSGCFTGHLFAAGRRREYATEILSATPVGSATTVRYTADVTDDEGRPLGTAERTARVPAAPGAIALGDLTRTWTAAWVYPIVPMTLALDAVAVPLLLVMSPAVLIVGD